MATEAGFGEHHIYKIMATNTTDHAKLTAGNHYIRIESVAWYINKTSNWFSERMASGTLEIKLADGLEKYQAALGTFSFSGGAKIAPVFERPVLNDRVYHGGSISLVATLSSLKKDTVLGGILKNAANASLGILSGMVDTASLAGPTKLLSAAGEELVSGVRNVLKDSNAKSEPVFDFSTGLEFSIQPESFIGPIMFVLFHRGAELSQSKLKIQQKDSLLLPFYNDKILDDGAWLLIRIKRRDGYSGVRDWFKDMDQLKTRLNALVEDVSNGYISKENGLDQLKPSSTGDQTIVDDYFKLRGIIHNDGVLSFREAGLYAGQLNSAIKAAKNAIESGSNFKDSIETVKKSLLKGTPIQGELGEAFEKEVNTLANSRKKFIVEGTNERRIAKLSGNEAFSNMQYIPQAVEQGLNFNVTSSTAY